MELEEEVIALAEAHAAAGRLVDAAGVTRSILQRNARCTPALILHGKLCSVLGRQTEAFQAFRSAALLLPGDAEPLALLANVLLRSGQLSGAAECCGKALAIDPNCIEAYLVLGRCHKESGHWQTACDIFAEAVRRAPEHYEAHFELGAALESGYRLEEAERAYRHAINLSPTSLQAYGSLGRVQAILGQGIEAAATFRSAYELAPVTSSGMVFLAKALSEEGLPAEACDVLRRADEFQPRDPEALPMLGRLLRELGTFDEAAAVYARAIKHYPNAVSSYLDYAYCKRLDETDDAILGKLAEIAKSGLKVEDAALAEYALGKAAEDADNFAVAMSHFERANRHMLARLTEPFDPQSDSALIDKIIATTPDSELARWARYGNRDARPVFIVGMIRSGTTLLEQLLVRHPDIGAAGELIFMPRHASKFSYSERDAILERGPALAEEYLAELTAGSPDKCRIIDKMPLNHRIVGYIHALFPNARFIHCRRDPLDTCLSIYTTPLNGAVPFAHDKGNIAHFYLGYLRLMDHWRSVLPSANLIEVDYESVVTDNLGEVRRVAKFLELDWDDSYLRADSKSQSVRTPSVWQVRQPIYRSSIGRWKRFEPWLGEFKELRSKSV